MKLKYMAAPLVAGALLVPVTLPAQAAADPAPLIRTAPVSSSDADHAKSIIKDLDGQADKLGDLLKFLPAGEYKDQVVDLLHAVFNLRRAAQKIATGKVPFYKLDTLSARVQLVTTIGQTIHDSVNNFQTKPRQANVTMGLEITKAVVILIDPMTTKDEITAEIAAVKDRYKAGLAMPDLKDTDPATIYTKSHLNKAIWQVRHNRAKNLAGKKDRAVIKELNKEIAKAVGVWFRAKSTVGDCKAAEAELNDAYQKALAAPDKEKAPANGGEKVA